MNINRRGALVAIGAVAFGAELANSSENTLSADLARLGAHEYSEEGIPMFLACENLAAPRTSQERPPLPSPLNKEVASAFHRYSAEWQRLHPNASPADVGKIVELLAERDFAHGGAESSL